MKIKKRVMKKNKKSRGVLFLEIESKEIEKSYVAYKNNLSSTKKDKEYFNLLTERAIVAYNREDNDLVRNEIYKNYIDRPFNKMVENLIHTFKTYYFNMSYEDIKAYVVHHFIEKIHMYNPKVAKAFSYFSIVGRNYLIANNNWNYGRIKSKVDLNTVDDELDVVSDYLNEQDNIEVNLFIDMFIKYMENNTMYIFNKEKDIIIADGVIELFKERKNIPDFNKKKLYILIRERTGVRTQYITRVVKVIREIYFHLYNAYLKTGKVEY